MRDHYLKRAAEAEKRARFNLWIGWVQVALVVINFVAAVSQVVLGQTPFSFVMAIFCAFMAWQAMKTVGRCRKEAALCRRFAARPTF